MGQYQLRPVAGAIWTFENAKSGKAVIVILLFEHWEHFFTRRDKDQLQGSDKQVIISDQIVMN